MVGSKLVSRIFKRSSNSPVPNLSPARGQVSASTDQSSSSTGTHRAASNSPSASTAHTQDLWDEAYDELRVQNEEVLVKFEALLLNEPDIANSPIDADDRERKLALLLDRKVQEAKDGRWKLPSTDIVVRDQVDKILRLVIGAKDFISSAVSSEPHASLAWAGISTLLPLVTASLQQDQDALNGVVYISQLVWRFRPVAHRIKNNLFQLSNPQLAPSLLSFKRTVVKLFSQILEFEIRLTCQLSHSAASQYLRNLVAADKWKDILEQIKATELQCHRDLDVMGFEDIKADLKSQDDKLSDIRDTGVQILNRLQENSDARNLGQQIEDRALCLQYFSPTVDCKAAKNRNPKRDPETCLWFFDHPKYQEWQSNTSGSLLLVTAEPGCGKSTLAKHLVDEVFSKDRRFRILYFFFKDDNGMQMSLSEALCAMLHQTFFEHNEILDRFTERIKKYGNNIRSQCTVLWDFLVEASSASSTSLLCVVDALDEGDEQSRLELLRLLEAVYGEQSQSCSLSVVITARPYYGSQYRFNRLVKLPQTFHVAGEEAPIGAEINTVIHHQTKTLTLDDDVKEYLESRLLEMQGNSRTYLWVSMVFKTLREDPAYSGIKRKAIDLFLNDLPPDVPRLYEQVLSKSSKPAQARTLLHIIVAAFRPLSLSELNIAFYLASNDDVTSREDLDVQSDEHFRLTLRDTCGLFVTIVDGIVYLIHQTARAFLISSPDQRYDPGNETTVGHTGKWKNTVSLSRGHQILAISTVSYLLMEDFSYDNPYDDWKTLLPDTGEYLWDPDPKYNYVTLCESRKRKKERYPFLAFASAYFLYHVRETGDWIQVQSTKFFQATPLEQLLDISNGRFWLWFAFLVDIDSTPWTVTNDVVDKLVRLISISGPLAEDFLNSASAVTSTSRPSLRLSWRNSARSFRLSRMISDLVFQESKGSSHCESIFAVKLAIMTQSMGPIMAVARSLPENIDEYFSSSIYQHSSVPEDSDSYLSSIVRRNLSNMLVDAIRLGHESIARKMFDIFDAEEDRRLRRRDILGGDAFQAAAVAGSTELISLCIQQNVPVDNHRGSGGERRTPLIEVIIKGSVEAAKMLVAAKADLSLYTTKFMQDAGWHCGQMVLDGICFRPIDFAFAMGLDELISILGDWSLRCVVIVHCDFPVVDTTGAEKGRLLSAIYRLQSSSRNGFRILMGDLMRWELEVSIRSKVSLNKVLLEEAVDEITNMLIDHIRLDLKGRGDDEMRAESAPTVSDFLIDRAVCQRVGLDRIVESRIVEEHEGPTRSDTDSLREHSVDEGVEQSISSSTDWVQKAHMEESGLDIVRRYFEI